MTNRVESPPLSSITMEISSHEPPVKIGKEPQKSDAVGSAALPVLVQMAAAAPPPLQREEHEQRFMKPQPPAKRRQPTHTLSSRRTTLSTASSSSAAPQAAPAAEQKKITSSSEQEKSSSPSKKEKKGVLGEAIMYGKVAFAACVAPDALQLVENVVEQPTISGACVASVNALSNANIATRIGGAVFLTPSVCRRILFGTPWEQAATFAAGATALYCTGGAIVPTLIFAEGAGLIAHGADGTRNAIVSTAKKVTTACTNYFSRITSGHRPSIRQTFQNFYARIRTGREAQRTSDRQQRIDEARHSNKKETDTQKPDDSQAPQP